MSRWPWFAALISAVFPLSIRARFGSLPASSSVRVSSTSPSRAADISADRPFSGAGQFGSAPFASAVFARPRFPTLAAALRLFVHSSSSSLHRLSRPCCLALSCSILAFCALSSPSIASCSFSAAVIVAAVPKNASLGAESGRQGEGGRMREREEGGGGGARWHSDGKQVGLWTPAGSGGIAAASSTGCRPHLQGGVLLCQQRCRGQSESRREENRDWDSAAAGRCGGERRHQVKPRCRRGHRRGPIGVRVGGGGSVRRGRGVIHHLQGTTPAERVSWRADTPRSNNAAALSSLRPPRPPFRSFLKELGLNRLYTFYCGWFLLRDGRVERARVAGKHQVWWRRGEYIPPVRPMTLPGSIPTGD